MITFVDYFNFINSFFGLSLYSYDKNKKCFYKSHVKIGYCSTILIITIFVYPSIINFIVSKILDISGSHLAELVSIFQTLSELALSVSLMLYKLLNYNKDISCRNNYEKLKEFFDKHSRNGPVSQLNIANRRNILLIISAVLFYIQVLTTVGVLSRIITSGTEGYYYAACYAFTYSQIALTGNIFFERILQHKFMISQINRTLETYLETLTYEIKYRSKAHCEIVSCKMSDDLDKLQELNSSIYSLIAELMQYESFSMIIVFLQKFIEIIIPLFYQFVAQYLYVIQFYNAPQFLIFGVFYISCTTASVCLYIGICERMQQEMSTTAKILHEFPVHKTDDRLKESINRFSLQILQEKRPISVCGMFNVDNTLLYSMISSMTSYLILLVQFQLQGVGSSKG
uniref:Gustatory receptor n=1 Tax=Phlebotomus papatasi TaxID=29031 RepID=A0A3F2ZEQ5_PHLPP